MFLTERNAQEDDKSPETLKHRRQLNYLVTTIIFVFILIGGIFFYMNLRTRYACEAAAREVQEIVRQAQSVSSQTEGNSRITFNASGDSYRADYADGKVRILKLQDEFIGTRYDTSGEGVLVIFVDRVDKTATTMKSAFDNSCNQNFYPLDFYNHGARYRLMIYENCHTSIVKIR